MTATLDKRYAEPDRLNSSLMNTECKRSALELASTINGEAWYGDSLREILEGVTAEQARRHPLPSVHSIWEIVLHLDAWIADTGLSWTCTGRATRDRTSPFGDVVIPHECEQVAAHVQHHLVILESRGIPSAIQQEPDGYFTDVKSLTVVGAAFGSRGKRFRRHHILTVIDGVGRTEGCSHRAPANRLRAHNGRDRECRC
jgi:hypothetical protein